MKKTNLDGKLALKTETLMPLQADVLDHVAGGASIGNFITRVSCLSCIVGCTLGIDLRTRIGGGQGGQGGQ